MSDAAHCQRTLAGAGVTIRRRRTCSRQKAAMTSASWSAATSSWGRAGVAAAGLGWAAQRKSTPSTARRASSPARAPTMLARPTSAWSDPPLPAVNIQAAAAMTAPKTNAAARTAASHRRRLLTARSVPDPTPGLLGSQSLS
jgi:hypothetical protein